MIGWNINHRLGYAKANMPTWVKDVIQEKKCRYYSFDRNFI